MGAMRCLVERRKLRPGDACQHPRREFDNLHVQAGFDRDRGNLQPDIAAAGDHQLRTCGKFRAERVHIGDRAHHVQTLELGAGNGQAPRPAAGGQDELAVFQRLADAERERAARTVDGIDGGGREEFDVRLAVGLGAAQQELLRGGLAGQKRFRQRRAMVRQMRLGAEQRDGAREAALAEPGGNLAAGMARADNHHVPLFCHGRQLLKKKKKSKARQRSLFWKKAPQKTFAPGGRCPNHVP